MDQIAEISVSNIREFVTKEKLNQVFSDIGQVINLSYNDISHKAKITFSSSKYCLESIQKLNHQQIFSNDLHVSLFRSPELKFRMRKWKILVQKILEEFNYNDLYSYFEKFGQIHHLSYYPEKRLATVQYFLNDSAENCIQDQNEKSHDFSVQYAWPQFSNGSGHQYIEIRGLPDNYDENDMEKLVKIYGKIASISMLYYLPHLNKTKTVAFVSFETRNQQKAAITSLDSKKIDRKMIYVWHLSSTSPFNTKYSGDLSEFYYFVPIKGKHYIEFINPPGDLDEPKMRGICGKFGHVYDVSIHSKLKDNNSQSNITSHVAFTTKGPLKRVLQALSGQYEVRRLPKSSPFYDFYNLNKDDDIDDDYFTDDE